ncbi:MAG: hypothetical protein IKD76_02865 [Clostridia bacterium]|nr:hypothetical protein [Clostridia bacterium]
MEQNKFLDGILDKVQPVKEVIDKVEDATGKKIGDLAGDVGEKITGAIKEQNPDNNIVDLASKVFGKK